MSACHAIGKTINALKWPVALISVLTLPATLTVGLNLIERLSWGNPSATRFLVGLVGYLLLWGLLLSKRVMGSLFSTFIHELTHALFAWLTFNSVSDLKLTWSKGGSIKVHGHPHWLITLAPYIFPTLSVALWLVVALSEGLLSRPILSALWLDLLMGASLGFFWATLKTDLRASQPDIKSAGRLFSLLVVPHFALTSSLLITALGAQGTQGVSNTLAHTSALWWRALQHSFTYVLTLV